MDSENNIGLIRSIGKKVICIRQSLLKLNLIYHDVKVITYLDLNEIKNAISKLTSEKSKLENQIAKLLKSQYGHLLKIGDEFHISSFDIKNDYCLVSFSIVGVTIERCICLSTGEVFDLED